MVGVASSLLVDGAWSVGQVQRWGLEVPEDALRVEGYLGLTHYRVPQRVALFVRLDLAHLPLSALRHLAGVAEMRLRLGVPPDPEVWRVSHRRVHPVEEPDAVWLAPEGPVAVEYDAGAYSRGRVQAKGQAFALRFVGQVWGVPIPGRAGTLRGLLPASSRVLLAPWM